MVDETPCGRGKFHNRAGAAASPGATFPAAHQPAHRSTSAKQTNTGPKDNGGALASAGSDAITSVGSGRSSATNARPAGRGSAVGSANESNSRPQKTFKPVGQSPDRPKLSA